MGKHSKKLEETSLWRFYQAALPFNSKRSSWVKKVYDTATAYLMDVRQTFQNYTLHDETHVVNVMDAMAGILGNQISKLTVSELELLILAACLHDLGMVYTEEEKRLCCTNRNLYQKFLREHRPDLLGCPPEEWPEDTLQWYLRSLHAFRLPQVFQNPVWKELLTHRPSDAVPHRCILAVCQAHGEAPKEFHNSRDMEYLNASEADPLFCALLLRLADLLDFDDTRAPQVLYSYVTCNETSRIEWDKHQASSGFTYPAIPSTHDLPYKATCTNPGIEHTIRDFLNWIDEELGICTKLQQSCHAEWQRSFPFPRAVARTEIESEGYTSGDFCLTMDQSKILDLLTGEQLYEQNDVFVRELLQNAIDATLLRSKMDPSFSLKDTRIDLWEWNDRDGTIWFRIDDRGTGMTQGMLQRYFLKVGNSYYTSQELTRDLREHNQSTDYQSISRFGIGFLSCFLCGTYAEVSTLYFDSSKNRDESPSSKQSGFSDYGLRLQVTGLTGYYTLKNQAEQHLAEIPLNAPEISAAHVLKSLEWNGYRAEPGTSIAIRLDPGKLGAMDLRESVKKYLCCAQVPVYYNGERLGRTYEEVMQEVHKKAGEVLYDLSPSDQKKFDETFPALCGQYPKLAISVVPLDSGEYHVLPGLSGVIVKYEVRFEKKPTWHANYSTYVLHGAADPNEQIVTLGSYAENPHPSHFAYWSLLKTKYEPQQIERLEQAFQTLSACPSPAQLGEVWHPFSEEENLVSLWNDWLDSQQMRSMQISLEGKFCPTIGSLTGHRQNDALTCCYHGIVAGSLTTGYHHPDHFSALFLLEDKWRPTVTASRSRISTIPLEILSSICGILNHAKYNYGIDFQDSDWRQYTLRQWRQARSPALNAWMQKNQKAYFSELQQELHTAQKDPQSQGRSLNLAARFIFPDDGWSILSKYLLAYLQDTFQMTVDYEAGQIITFREKEADETNNQYDFFPPMLFSQAADTQNRRYLCSANSTRRRCITADHPFTQWLLEYADILNRYYPRQLQQVAIALCKDDADEMIEHINHIRMQLLSLREHHGIDLKTFPQLSEDDFWFADM